MLTPGNVHVTPGVVDWPFYCLYRPHLNQIWSWIGPALLNIATKQTYLDEIQECKVVTSPDCIYNSFPHLFIHFLKGSFSRGCFSIKPLLRQGCSKLHRTLPSLRTCYRRWCTLLLSRKRPSHQKWRPRRPQWNQRQRKNPSLLEERQQKLRRLLQRVQVCLVWFITAYVGRYGRCKDLPKRGREFAFLCLLNKIVNLEYETISQMQGGTYGYPRISPYLCPLGRGAILFVLNG